MYKITEQDTINSGLLLKYNLGLENFKYVKVARALVSSYKILFLFYDSRRPDIPLTTKRILNWPWTTMIFSGIDIFHNTDKGTMFSPPIPIENWNGEIRGALIITADLVGNNLIDPKVFTKRFKEGKEHELPKIVFHLNEYTVADLRQNAFTAHDKKFLKIRQKDGEQGSFIKTVIWSNPHLTIVYEVNPTYGDSPGNFTKNANKTSTKDVYTGKLQFQNVTNYIKSLKDFLKLSKGEQVEIIRTIINLCDVKIWSDDPSWFYQGHFENATELDYSMYDWPVGKPHATGRWAQIKTNNPVVPYFSLSKHAIEVLTVTPFLAPEIAKMIREKYE